MISIQDCAVTGASHCDRINPIFSDIVFIFMETQVQDNACIPIPFSKTEACSDKIHAEASTISMLRFFSIFLCPLQFSALCPIH